MSAAVAWKERLRVLLRDGMKARDSVRVSVARTAIAAIERAEAVGVASVSTGVASSVIAGAVSGLGAGEVERRALSEGEVRGVLEGELAERRAAVAQLEAVGRLSEVAGLRAQCEVLVALLAA
ncbi:MAG: hypothetical protein U0228_17765 [Myxococcaceae bacterium]